MYPVIRNRKKQVLEQKEYVLKNGEVIEYFTFPALSDIPQIMHTFSTREGGVSRNEFSSLNFSYIRGDDTDCVTENYSRMAQVFGKECKDFVTTDQTHTINIRIVTAEDAGKGITIPRDYTDIDGLITNVKGLILSCFFADCVPLYFVDRQKCVIGMAHSGWRGTVNQMGACMVRKMQEVYNCNPSDIVACIGPSICQECYEISEEVALQFRQGFWAEKNIQTYCDEAFAKGVYPHNDILIPGKANDKWQLDLWLANLAVLRSAGIPLENISVTDICTCCNAPYLFSHRASNGKRGNLGAFLMIKG